MNCTQPQHQPMQPIRVNKMQTYRGIAKPATADVYARVVAVDNRRVRTLLYSYWDGAQWCMEAHTIEQARANAGIASWVQNREWGHIQ
jgi:hypothetical protein